MRLKLYFQLENEKIDLDYRRIFLSYIKKSLQDYDESYFESLYRLGDNKIKPFTFSVFIPHPQFQPEDILIKEKYLEMTISFADNIMAAIFYNAFNHTRLKSFPLKENKMKLINISMLPEKRILGNSIVVKFLSPLVVRDRNQETRKDYYYSFEHEKFISMLKINIREQLKNSELEESLLDGFEVKAIQAKKTVVKFYEKQIEASLGTFELQGDKRLLEYLYKAGIGSKHSSGFGMFTII